MEENLKGNIKAIRYISAKNLVKSMVYEVALIGHSQLPTVKDYDDVVFREFNSEGAHTHHVLNSSHLDYCNEWTRTHFIKRIELSQIQRYGEVIEYANETE